MYDISRKLMAVMIALFAATGIKQSFAEVQLDLKESMLFVYGTISKSDGDYVLQHEADIKKGGRGLWVYLNSVGGDA